jgi:long-chain acyl-CoA synthetase
MSRDGTNTGLEPRVRPWHALYRGESPTASGSRCDVLSLFTDALKARPAADAVVYFDRRISFAELHDLSDALAVWMRDAGVGAGDRVAIILQNVPQFLIGLLAAWKLSALPTPMNPMYRDHELRALFADAAPKVIVCHTHDVKNIRRGLLAASHESILIATAPTDFQSRNDPRVLPADAGTSSGVVDFIGAISGVPGRKPVPVPVDGNSLGLLLYTSGTTGTPKGAVARHSALTFNGSALAHWCDLNAASRILAIAPLFHITGIVCHVIAAFRAQCSIILSYRFEPSVVLDAIREHRPTYSIGAITAFNALLNIPDACAADFACFDSVYSGGAPIPPALRLKFRERFGKSIHSSFGMTESAAPTHLCPLGMEAPVHPESGALSIGIPIYDTDAIIVDEAGHCVPPGTAGELWMRGPQIMVGYWKKPGQTAQALTDGWLHSGDIAVMDEAGWFYLLDRMKDVIIASGFKVWPREVEDVLYSHPAVREAAVVGVADSYRGETVKAYVSLKPGTRASSVELIEHCREKLASYKAPRSIEFMAEIPKTVSGKIQRSVVRDLGSNDGAVGPPLGRKS